MSLKLTFEPQSDVGLERSENQDAFGSCSVDGYDVYIVCDGMGGHAGGSTASRLAVVTIEEHLAKAQTPIDERIRTAFELANEAIWRKAQKQRELRGMGTTAVAIAIDHEKRVAHVAHVGDSRAYRLRGGTFRQLTKDHTMVQRLIDDGILPPEAAKNHPNANVISRSLGGGATVEVEFLDPALDIEEGDIFVLCSDGLYGLVEDDEVARIVSGMMPRDAARFLIQRAREEGGHDNITVEVVIIGDQPLPPDEYAFEYPPSGPGSRKTEPDAAPISEAARTTLGNMAAHKTGATVALQAITDLLGPDAAQDASPGSPGPLADTADPADAPAEQRSGRSSTLLVAVAVVLVILAVVAIAWFADLVG